MQTGYVIGRIITTAKDKGYKGKTLLIIQPVKSDGTRSKDHIIATDSVGAGAGEFVFWVRGKEAAFPFLPESIAVDATVVGIIDRMDVK
ncbi:EutN/CcmL family microcompartment protein [bacterium]|nr:EutN/CcmL family microcompartment protein [bacterium]